MTLLNWHRYSTIEPLRTWRDTLHSVGMTVGDTIALIAMLAFAVIVVPFLVVF